MPLAAGPAGFESDEPRGPALHFVQAWTRTTPNPAVDALRVGSPALDVVEAVVRELETDPCFNSGRGSALTRAGTVEMGAQAERSCRGRRGAAQLA